MAAADEPQSDIVGDVVTSHRTQRQEYDKTLQQEAREQRIAEIRARRAAEAEQAAAAPVAPEVPEEAPEATEAPAEETDDTGLIAGTAEAVADVGTGFARGVAKEAADLVDNFGHVLDSVTDYFGIQRAGSEESLNAFFDQNFPDLPEEERARRIAAVANPARRATDAALGEAEGTAEGIGESLGALPFIMGGMALAAATVPVTGPVAVGATALAGGGLAAGAIANTNDETMGDMIEDQWGPNFYSNITATDGDMGRAEKFFRHVADDVAMGIVGEGVIKVGGKIITRIRKSKDIVDDAVHGGIATDEVVVDALNKLDEKAAEADLLDLAVEQLDKGVAEQTRLADDAAARAAAADEATLLEPIGLNRSPVIKTQYADMGDDEFAAALDAADKRVFALEADENMLKAETDPAVRRDLIDAQDDFTALELEGFRRKSENLAPEELARELRGLKLTDPEDKIKATMIASGMSKRSADEIAEFETAMEGYAKLSPDHAEVLGGQMEKFEATLREVGETLPTAPKGQTGVPMLDEGADAIRLKAQQVREEMEELNQKVIQAAETSPADGGYLEAMRQVNKGKLSKEADEALGKAATKNAKQTSNALTTPERTVGGVLKATDKAWDEIGKLKATGDITGAARLLGASVFDSTNFGRIADGENGGIEGVFRAFAELFGNADSSARVQTQRGIDVTDSMAHTELQRLAVETGGSVEKIAAALEKSLPGANLDVQLTALRHTETALAQKVDDIAADYGTSRWTSERRAEAIQWGTLLAQVNDRRSGIVSEIGRALNALKIEARPAGFLDLDSPTRNARRAQLDKIIAGQGGPEGIDEWIASVRLAGGDLNQIAEGAKKGTKRRATSLGDVLHRAFVVNLLSGTKTATINLSSNLLRGGLWEPTMEVAGAAAMSARRAYSGQGNAMEPLQEAAAYFQGMLHGSQSALRLAVKIIDGKPAVKMEGSAYKSFATRRRMTAPAGNSLQDIHLDTPFSSVGMRQLVHDGIPVTVPLTGGNMRLPILGPATGPIRRQSGDEIGAVLEAKSGAVHKAVDYAGRLFESPFSILAGGDELTAAISYNGKAFQQILKMANAMPGLKGAKKAEWIEQTKRDLARIDDLREALDPEDVEAVAKFKQLEQIHEKGNLAAEVSTHTQKAGQVTQYIVQGKGKLPMLRWMAPFVKTPTQLLKDGATDFNAVGQGYQLAKTMLRENASQDEVAEAAGRFAMVAALNTTIIAGIHSGRVTGSGPMNWSEREMWLNERDAEGNLINVPNSIEVPGVGRVQYNRMDPVALPMTVAADIQSLIDRTSEGEGNGFIMEFATLLANTMKNKTYLESMVKWTALMDENGFSSQGAQDIIVSTGTNTFVPWSRFWANAKQGGDARVPEDLRETEEGELGPEMTYGAWVANQGGKINIQKQGEGLEGLMIQAGSTVGASLPPGISDGFMALWQKVAARNMELAQTPTLDFFGEVRYSLPGWGPDWASPFMVQEGTGKHTPLNAELSKMGFGVSINKRFGKIDGIKLSPTQQHKFQKLFAKPKNGDSVKEQLERLIIDPETGQVKDSFNRLGDTVGDTPGRKVKMVNSILGRRRDRAIKQLLASDSDLRAKVEEARTLQRKMNTKEGSDEVREERKPQSFFEALIK